MKNIRSVATVDEIRIVEYSHFKLVKYSINEVRGCDWDAFEMPISSTMEEINAKVNEEVSKIQQSDLDNYKKYLSDNKVQYIWVVE